MIGEVYNPLEYAMGFYSDNGKKRTHMPLNCTLIRNIDKSLSAIDIKNKIDKWIHTIPKGQWTNWVVSVY